MNPRKKPAFLRQEWFRMGNQRKKWRKWRKPRGNQSKLRMHIAGKGFLPKPGYGSPKNLRGVHPSGLREILVSNVDQLANLDKGKQAIKIAGSVGGLKRLAIQKAAEERGLKILNPKKIMLRRKQEKTKEQSPVQKPPQAEVK